MRNAKAALLCSPTESAPALAARLTADWKVEIISTWPVAVVGHSLVLLDLDLAPDDWPERLAALARIVPVVCLGSRTDPAWVVRVIRSGARDYIPKTDLSCLLPAAEIALKEAATPGASHQEWLASLKMMIDRMPIGCILNDAGFHFTYWNPAAEELFGYKFSEVAGKHPFDTITPAASRELVADLFHRLANGDMAANALGENRTKDGRTIICEWTNTPLVDSDGKFLGILSMCQDVTARVKAEEKLLESEARFRQLAETVPECFWLSGLGKSEFIYVSPAFDKIWGFSRERLFTEPDTWLGAVHPLDAVMVREALLAKRTREPVEAEYRIVRPDGSVRWVRERAFPIRNSGGDIYRVAGLAADITNEKELEGQFLQAQKMESVGRLAGGVAHDFGNMLTAISSFSRLALDTIPTDSQARGDIEQVLKAAERATAVTRQLLAFARRQTHQPALVDLNALLTNLQKMLRRLVRENIQLTIETQHDLWPVFADRSQIEQVLINLVVNAVDAMPRGGYLLLKTRNLVCTEPHLLSHIRIPIGEYVLLSVTDTGEGMSEATQAQIFEPFFTTKEAGKGTGLGLATVYGIVQQSAGFIDVASQKDVGTTFFIALKRPVEKPEDPKVPV